MYFSLCSFEFSLSNVSVVADKGIPHVLRILRRPVGGRNAPPSRRLHSDSWGRATLPLSGERWVNSISYLLGRDEFHFRDKLED